MKAMLALEDGTIFRGIACGAAGERAGEVVFNTSMTGYQEILTDPSYKGQIVTMTYPMIGNYGVNDEDLESSGPRAEGYVVRELSRIASSWRSRGGLSDYLERHGVVGIEGVDTRSLTRHIRTAGAMKAVISTECLDEKELISRAQSSPGIVGRDLVQEVTCEAVYRWEGPDRQVPPGYRVVVLDCGAKRNIMRMLAHAGCEVTVVPAHTCAEEIMALKPHGVVLSNGPGDPSAVPYVVDTVRALIGKLPLLGICLGHQMLGLALGGKTYKLKFGHRGGNQPVKDLGSGKVSITSQNHGFCLDMESLKDREIELTHINLNDHTPEGMRHKTLPVFSVQYHPEASPGPHDASYLFAEFVNMMQRWARA
jgi:carbamoyl-phosphate synthase small subunit